MSKWRARAIQLFPELQPEIQRSATIGELWIELSAKLHSHYTTSSESTAESCVTFARNVHLYALWCHGAADWRTKEAAGIEFFESIVRFAIRSGKLVYQRIVDDLVDYIGVPTIKNNAVSFGYGLSPGQLENFLRQVDEAARRRARRSAKK
jgi:hypothetical protein